MYVTIDDYVTAEYNTNVTVQDHIQNLGPSLWNLDILDNIIDGE